MERSIRRARLIAEATYSQHVTKAAQRQMKMSLLQNRVEKSLQLIVLTCGPVSNVLYDVVGKMKASEPTLTAFDHRFRDSIQSLFSHATSPKQLDYLLGKIGIDSTDIFGQNANDDLRPFSDVAGLVIVKELTENFTRENNSPFEMDGAKVMPSKFVKLLYTLTEIYQKPIVDFLKCDLLSAEILVEEQTVLPFLAYAMAYTGLAAQIFARMKDNTWLVPPSQQLPHYSEGMKKIAPTMAALIRIINTLVEMAQSLLLDTQDGNEALELAALSSSQQANTLDRDVARALMGTLIEQLQALQKALQSCCSIYDQVDVQRALKNRDDWDNTSSNHFDRYFLGRDRGKTFSEFRQTDRDKAAYLFAKQMASLLSIIKDKNVEWKTTGDLLFGSNDMELRDAFNTRIAGETEIQYDQTAYEMFCDLDNTATLKDEQALHFGLSLFTQVFCDSGIIEAIYGPTKYHDVDFYSINKRPKDRADVNGVQLDLVREISTPPALLFFGQDGSFRDVLPAKQSAVDELRGRIERELYRTYSCPYGVDQTFEKSSLSWVTILANALDTKEHSHDKILVGGVTLAQATLEALKTCMLAMLDYKLEMFGAIDADNVDISDSAMKLRAKSVAKYMTRCNVAQSSMLFKLGRYLVL